MPASSKTRSQDFRAESYELSARGKTCRLIIRGKKLPPPSKRITLQQKNLKILSAKIKSFDKRGGKLYKIIRINHLSTFQQVRIHTEEILYPGDYELVIEYELSPEKLQKLSSDTAECLIPDLIPLANELTLGEKPEFKLV